MSVWTPRATVAAIIEDDGRFLMVEERDPARRLVLNQPAGHLEDGESLVDAIRREVLEETGWEFAPGGIVGIYKWRRDPGAITFIRCCFFGAAVRQHHDRPPDADIEYSPWLSADDIMARTAQHRSPMVGRCLQDYLHGRRFALELINEID